MLSQTKGRGRRSIYSPWRQTIHQQNVSPRHSHVDGDHHNALKDTFAEWLSPGHLDQSDAISLFLNTVLACKHLPKVPNSRHISLWYTEWNYDVIKQLVPGAFSRRVSHLSIEYSFTTPNIQLDIALRSLIRRNAGVRYVFTPGIRQLSFLSAMASELFMADVFWACPNIETLEVTTPKDLHLCAPLPGRVRTLILRHPRATLSQEQMVMVACQWNLFEALEDGLFNAVGTTEPRIVTRSGTPDPTVGYEILRAFQH